MKPNMNLAPDSTWSKVELYFDIASKNYGVRKYNEIIHDGVYIKIEKHLDMTLEQLEKLVEEAKSFIGIHKKY